jgi:hypothetical protein
MSDKPEKIAHMRVRRTHFEDFGKGYPGWNARYEITDAISGAQCEVRGPNTNGCTWHGDITAMPWPNAAMAFAYARVHAEGAA